MKYALLIYEAPDEAPELSAEEREAVHREYMDISAEPSVYGGAHLQPPETTTTVQVRGGQLLTTDGPFADTKEVFAGFFLVEADDLDGALDTAARIPAARNAGTVEVRPIQEYAS